MIKICQIWIQFKKQQLFLQNSKSEVSVPAYINKKKKLEDFIFLNFTYRKICLNWEQIFKKLTLFGINFLKINKFLLLKLYFRFN